MADESTSTRGILIGLAVAVLAGLAIWGVQIAKEKHEAALPPNPIMQQPTPPGIDVPGAHGSDHVIQNPSTKNRLVHGARFYVEHVSQPRNWAGEGIPVDKVVFHDSDFEKRSNSYYKRFNPIRIPPNDDAVNIRAYVVAPQRAGYHYSGRLVFYYGDPKRPETITFQETTIVVSSREPK